MASNGTEELLPMMYIDPVYCTVSSQKRDSYPTLNDIDWKQHAGLTGGIIQFMSQGNIPKQPNVRYYVKMSEDTSTSDIADYMDMAWRFTSPNIILSVISSPSHWKPWVIQNQKENFQKGLIKIINTTTTWLLTNGKNSGACKLIGDAIKKEKERRYMLANNYSRDIITTSKLQKLPQITAIGIAAISELTYSDDFEREGTGITIEVKNQGKMSMSEVVELNPELTNFVLMDGIKTQKETDNKRLKLEDRFRRPIGKPKKYGRTPDINDESSDELQPVPSTSTPLVSILIQGSPCDIEHVCDLIKVKVPVIVIKGTGAAADLFSFAYDEIHQRPEDDHLNSYIKPELLKRIQKTFPDDFKADVLARNKCRDMIIECVQYAMKSTRNFLTILDIETDPTGFENLDKYILYALFEAQEPKKGREIQEQIQSNLKLTLDWNRTDIAQTKIFEKYDWMSIKISKDLFDRAMIKRDRHKFVKLCLDKQAIQLNKYFNFKKLVYLINHYEDSEFFRTVCLGEMLGYSPITDYPVKKKFVYGENCPLNVILEKTTYLSNLVSMKDFDMDEMEEDVISPAAAERKAINVLVYWAALNFDIELTKTLWKKTEEPMAMAFIVSMIWHSIGKRWCPDSDTKKKLIASAKDFSGMAVKLLQYSYEDSNVNTIAFLDKRLEDFNNKTIIELAHIAKNKHFIAHSVSQKWLNRRWAGNLLIKKSDWGPIKIPSWVKIYLSLVFVFPMFIWIKYDLADKKRRDKILEGDDEDPTLLEEPVLTRQTSTFQDKGATGTITFKMKSVWNYGKERFKVPIHLQFYYLWSAPITKFWLSQVFYILFLMLFSIATLHPNCGMMYLDIAVFGWILMIWVELVRSTITKKRKYKEIDLFWTVCEIIVMALIWMVILALRITPYFVNYFMYPTTKFVMGLGVLYFYYRVLFVFTPISPVLGPMTIMIKRMIIKDFLTWFRMFLIIMVSGAVTIHAVLYPNYPLVFDSVKQSLARALFAMFLTKIDDLEGDASCSYLYQNTSVSRCYSVPEGSFYSMDFHEKGSLYTNVTQEEKEYRNIALCPYKSLGGYFVVIQYLLIVKLIMTTLLYALFSNTTAQVQQEAEDIWKFQKYGLIVDYEEKLILPPPFNCISYIFMILREIFYFIRFLYKRCRGDCSSCCRKKTLSDGANKLSNMMIHTPEEYNYWTAFVKRMDVDEKKEQEDSNMIKTQGQILESLMSQLAEQRLFDGRLVKQISSLEQNVTSCQVALEELQHMIIKLHPNLHPTVVSSSNYIHVLSRQSPYPKTSIQRFPVFTKYVSWEIPYGVYDPPIYTCPTEKFPEPNRPYVDLDFLRSIMKSKVVSTSQEDIRDLTSDLGNIMPVWNTVSKVTINGKETTVDRTSFIKNFGVAIKYNLDSCNLPINPKGRTGLRGRGRLMRWGPNHYVMVVITRWKKKENSEDFIEIDGKKVLEVISIKDTENGGSRLPRGGDCGYMTMYSAVCKKFMLYCVEDATKQVNPNMNENDMIKFFRQYFPLPGPLTPFTTNVIFKGYLDDASNTDHAWKEVEVWNIHFQKGGGDLYLRNKEKKWKTVSSYNAFHGSQDLILQQAAALHNSYY